MVIIHILALHEHGSNNPLGVERKSAKDSLPFHPYYTVKDLFGLGVFLIVFALLVFFWPNLLSHPDNYIPANPLQTPPHIVPEWYFLPFYAILRAITFDVLFVPAKLIGVILMFGSILVLFVLPWLDTSPVRSSRFRPIHKYVFWVLVLDCVLLGYLGGQPAEGGFVIMAQLATALLLLPLPDPAAAARQAGAPPPGTRQHQRIGARPIRAGRMRTVMTSRPISGLGALAAALVAGAIVAPTVALVGWSGAAHAAGDAPAPIQRSWQHDGMFGTFDRAAAQRGFQVYREVCAGCHGVEYLAFRNLTELGFDEDTVAAIAAEYEVVDGPDDDGEMFLRPGRPADHLPSPYPNEQASRAANGGALPPDLSLITKARADGSNYLYSLLVGYPEEPPAEALEDAPEGMYYNDYFGGHWIAMPGPLMDDLVEYGDGTTPTVDQMAADVTVFLTWLAEPTLEARKQTGLGVLLFLIPLTLLFYATKRKVWADAH